MSDKNESYHSIIFQPPGEIHQTKGPWTSWQPLEEMLDHLEKEQPDGTLILIATSYNGGLDVITPEWHREMAKAYREAAEAEAEYKRIGKCSGCGACSAKEAESKCRPSQDPSGEYSCAGEGLWEDEQ